MLGCCETSEPGERQETRRKEEESEGDVQRKIERGEGEKEKEIETGEQQISHISHDSQWNCL